MLYILDSPFIDIRLRFFESSQMMKTHPSWIVQEKNIYNKDWNFLSVNSPPPPPTQSPNLERVSNLKKNINANASGWYF